MFIPFLALAAMPGVAGHGWDTGRKREGTKKSVALIHEGPDHGFSANESGPETWTPLDPTASRFGMMLGRKAAQLRTARPGRHASLR